MKTPEYETPDLGLAAYLSTEIPDDFKGHRRVGRRCFFVFHDSAELRNLINQWFTASGQTSARLYHDQLRSLKNLVHQE